MITLYAGAPMFGLPDASPFVVKTMLLLKMAGIPYQTKPTSFSKAPKGKMPYIETPDGLLGDSHFIKRHLETNHGADFSGGYSETEHAKGWTIARMLEEHLYFANVHTRWVPDSNFNIGPAHFFDDVPRLLRGFVRGMIRRKVKKMLKAQGLGRHTDDEILTLAKGDIDSVERLLGNKNYILGDRMSEYDATVFAFLLSAGCSHFDSRIGDDIRARPRVKAYLERIRSSFFPDAKL
jgi:glutathione S-transferase